MHNRVINFREIQFSSVPIAATISYVNIFYSVKQNTIKNYSFFLQLSENIYTAFF